MRQSISFALPVFLICVLSTCVLYSGVAAGSLPAAVATGDSLTNGYFPKLQARPAARDFAWQQVAAGGLNSKQYVGNAVHPSVGHPLDFGQTVLDLGPDVIVFMLGTNDAVHADPWFADEFVPNATSILEAFAESGAEVFVCTLPPIIRPGLEAADERVAYQYNPWLASEADQLGLDVIDLWTEIQALPQWQDLYSDGVHLYANNGAGFDWMAETIVEAVPEPTPDMSIAAGVGGAPVAQGHGPHQLNRPGVAVPLV